MTVTEAKLNQFLGKMVSDLGAAVNSVLVLIGDELGLYRARSPNSVLSPLLNWQNSPILLNVISASG